MYLSIIIPVYNTKPVFIEDCLNSLKYINCQFEAILVNDGSTDKVTLSYLENLKRGNLTIVNKPNGGLGSARNYGVNLASSEYIFPLDSDDKINEKFPEFIKFLIENKSVDILFGNLSRFGDYNDIVYYKPLNRLTHFFEENMLQACSFFKKSVWEEIKGYDEDFKTLEDYDFWTRAVLKNNKFHYLNSEAYQYRIISNGESLIQKTAHIIGDFTKIMESKIPISKQYFETCFINSFKETKKSYIFPIIKHYYYKKNIEDANLFSFFTNTYGLKFKKSANVSEQEITTYLHSKFINKKRKLIGLAIHLYLPNIYKTLIKLDAFSYKYNFI